MAFCGWLLSLSTFSEFIPVVACVNASFLFMAESSSIVWLDHISYTHPSTVGDLGSSHFPSLVNAHVQVAVFPFSGARARGRVAGSPRGSLCSSEPLLTGFCSGHTSRVPVHSVQAAFHVLTHTCFLWSFLMVAILTV